MEQQESGRDSEASAGKATPGPWEWDGDSRIDAVAFRKPTGHIIKSSDGTEHEYLGGLVALAYSCGDEESNSNHTANSRLIAAAPDMKAALDAALLVLSGEHDTDSARRLAEYLARAAIAKALGRSA